VQGESRPQPPQDSTRCACAQRAQKELLRSCASLQKPQRAVQQQFENPSPAPATQRAATFAPQRTYALEANAVTLKARSSVEARGRTRRHQASASAAEMRAAVPGRRGVSASVLCTPAHAREDGRRPGL